MTARQRGNGEGSVFEETTKKDENGNPTATRWVAQLRVDGRKVKRIAKTEPEAKRLLLELHKEHATTGAVAASMTVRDAVENFRTRQIPKKSPNTQATYGWCADVIVDAIGSIKAKDLQPERIEAMFAKLATNGASADARPMSRATLVKVRSVLAMSLDQLVKRRQITWNPARLAEIPTTIGRTDKRKSLTVDQARQLMKASDGTRLHALWVAMLFGGLRLGEALGLTWECVELDEGVVHVRGAVRLEDGKPTVVDELKTGSSRRSIKLAPQAVDALRVRLDDQVIEREGAADLWVEHGLVFTTSTGGPIDPNNARREFRKVIARAGLGDGWSPHSLRHSTASLLSAAGVPIERIADLLGHETSRVTADVYRHAVGPVADGAAGFGDILKDS